MLSCHQEHTRDCHDGIGIIFDVIFLISSILSLKSVPNLGYQFMILAEDLETELQRQRSELANLFGSPQDSSQVNTTQLIDRNMEE